jgi:hypothetical protein
MTFEELDALDDKIAAAIDKVCRLAGGENDDPPPRRVREIFKEAGLSVVLYGGPVGGGMTEDRAVLGGLRESGPRE